jgi:hypothetical protein
VVLFRIAFIWVKTKENRGFYSRGPRSQKTHVQKAALNNKLDAEVQKLGKSELSSKIGVSEMGGQSVYTKKYQSLILVEA